MVEWFHSLKSNREFLEAHRRVRSVLTHHHNTRSKSTSTPSALSATPLCKHCGLPGHKMTTSKNCLKDPKRILEQQDASISDDRMDTDDMNDVDDELFPNDFIQLAYPAYPTYPAYPAHPIYPTYLVYPVYSTYT
ncbi:hypothetical protein [Parasitella parasitica]|uniref:Uncharacterized protein n=1 Tax=Parasitella parasitica TaxID=35722 RepID=A0A0B7NT62_9FUNG|nr:hypothetical protein [Parasitella parasitica]